MEFFSHPIYGVRDLNSLKILNVCQLCTTILYGSVSQPVFRRPFLKIRREMVKERKKNLNTTKYHGNFCPANGNTGVNSVRYQMSLSRFFSRYLGLYLVLLCLYSFRTATEPIQQWRQKKNSPLTSFSGL